MIINGNDNGRSVTAIDDYDVSNVRSVHSNVGVSTFIADTILDRQKEVFDPGFEFAITAASGSPATSTATCQGISDFKGLVKVGDIIAYTTGSATNLDRIFNRVSVVGDTSLTLSAVETIDGICNGALPTSAATPTGIKVLSCDLENQLILDI